MEQTRQGLIINLRHAAEWVPDYETCPICRATQTAQGLVWDTATSSWLIPDAS